MRFRAVLVLVLTSGIISLTSSLDRHRVKTPVLNIKPAVASPLGNWETAMYPKLNVNFFPKLSAQSFLAIDLSSKKILAAQNENLKLPPASITKVMTAIIALDKYNTKTLLRVGDYDISEDEARMGLDSNDVVTVTDLLYALLLGSASDAAWALVNNYPGGHFAFVQAMNDKAIILNMKDTHFENFTGTEQVNHYSSSKDIVRLIEFTMNNQFFKETVKTKKYPLTIWKGVNKKTVEVENLNRLLGTVSGVLGGKTGFTKEAGECLVTVVERDKHRVATVVMQSRDRFGDSTNLIEWIYEAYTFLNFNLPESNLGQRR